jgi:hypothetical protein
MGIVYQARDPIISRKVALKTITTNIASDPNLLQRFYREAQSAGGLQHPNIITIYDMGEEGGLPYIAMELVEGQNLEQVISAGQDLPLSLKLGYGIQACRALDYAHKRGIVHRDIKPGNVMVNREGVVKVVDFGIARFMQGSRTQTGMLIGTFAYMSPDQYNGEHADERSDIWSFGVLLYELVSYKRPFPGVTPARLMQEICNQEPLPLREVAANCPAELETVVHRMLRKSANDRFQSMEDVLIELDPIWKGLQSETLKELVERGRQLVDEHEYSQARELLRQALQVDSANTQARNLLEKVNTELKRILIRPKAQECVQKGKVFLQNGKLQEARAEVEAALHLDSSFEPAHELQKQVQRRLDRIQLMAEWMQSSRQRLAEGLLDEARALLGRVLETEPEHEEAQALERQVAAEIGERERRLRLLDKMQRARTLWTQQNFAEAIPLLTELQKAFPEEPEVSKLLDAVREDQAEHSKQQRLGEARRLLAAQQFEACVLVLAELKKEYSAEPEIEKLLEAAEEGQAERDKQRALSEARMLLAQKRYDDCLTLLREIEARFPKDAEIEKLLNETREERAEEEKHQKLEEARTLLASQSFAECVAILAELKNNFPHDPEPPRLLEAVRHAETEQRKHQGLAEARNLLAARSYDECLDLLNRLQNEFPGESEVVRLLQAVREEQWEQEKKKQFAEARSHMAAQRHTEALAILDTLLTAHPEDAAVTKLRNLVLKEQQEKARSERLERERSALKRLVNEKKYLEAVSGAEALLREFPGDHDLARLVDFARSQQEQIEKQVKLQKFISEAQSFLQAGDFDAALRSAGSGVKSFPRNADLLRLQADAERRRKERETRKLIEQRVREIRVQINRDNYSDAVNLAKETLATLGPSTDVSQLLSSAELEMQVRERKKEQARQLETVRVLLKSGKMDEASRVLDDGLETEVFDPHDPRVEKVREEVQAARTGVAPIPPDPTAALPEQPAREYALVERAPVMEPPARVEESFPREVPAPHAASPQIGTIGAPAVPPPVIQPPATRPTPPPVEVEPDVSRPAQPVRADRRPIEAPRVSRKDRPPSPVERPMPLPDKVPVPLWKRPAAIGGVVLAGVVLAWVISHKPQSPKQPPDNRQQIALEQREAIQAADQSVATNDFEAALKTLQAAAALNGPLNTDIDKKIAGIESGIKNQQLRALLQQEEKLWQQALDQMSRSRFSETRATIQEILALPEGGQHRADAEQLRDVTIPRRQKDIQLFAEAEKARQKGGKKSLDNARDLYAQVIALDGPLRGQAQQSLDAVNSNIQARETAVARDRQIATIVDGARKDLQRDDFRSSRQKAAQIRNDLGSDNTSLIAEIDQAERTRFDQLVTTYNTLKSKDDEASQQRMSDLQPQFQPLVDSGGTHASAARSYMNGIPAVIAEMKRRAAGSRNDDAAFRRAVQDYDKARKTNDRSGLEAVRNSFQSLAQDGGSHAGDAQQYLLETEKKLDAMNILPQPPPPAVKREPLNATPADEAAVRDVVQKFFQAFEQRNPEGLRQVWPDMPQKKYEAYKGSFQTMSSIAIKVVSENVTISPDGSTATASIQSLEEETPKTEKKPRRFTPSWNFHLTKVNGGWVIADAQ